VQETQVAGPLMAGPDGTATDICSAAIPDTEASLLAAANEQLRSQVAQLKGQLSAAAAWQDEVRAMRCQLAGMEAAVADSEAARQGQEQDLTATLQQREQELLATSARLAATEAQLGALNGGCQLMAREAYGHGQPRPAVELLAAFALSQAQLTAALTEAAALLA
jgi:hypothetical protein